MKEHYDFSKAQQGRFYGPDMKLRLPLYLDEDVQIGLIEVAESEGIDLSALINRLLREDMQRIKCAGTQPSTRP